MSDGTNGANLEDALPEPDVYFDPPARCYYTRSSDQEFIQVSESSLKRELKSIGFCHEVGKSELVSELDRQLLKIQKERNVHYAAPLAGYPVGVLKFQGRRILITEAPTFIEPDEAVGWKTWESIFRRLFVPSPGGDEEGQVGEVQLWTWYSWLKIAMTTLRARKRRPGQALAIAGPAGCGKSLVQNLITRLIGGRSAKPYQYMTGGTPFNGELFTAEHLMIEDEAASFDYRTRVKMGTMIKNMVVDEDQRCHPKNRQGLTLRPFWRLSITLNDDPESLMVMPPVENVADKIIFLRAFPGPMPMPTETLEQWGAFMGVLEAELPGLVHFILKQWQIPADLRCGRYGVTHFHHPELMKMMSVLAPETKLLELIDTKVFPKDAAMWSAWEGKASDLEAELCGPSSSVAHEARKLLLYNSACGQYLGRLSHMHPDRITSRTLKGYTIWEIEPPPRLSAH